MAFLFPDKQPSELSELELLEDVLLTQNKVEADLRAIIAKIVDRSYGNVRDYMPVELSGVGLVDELIDALKHFSIDPPAYLKDFGYQMFLVWKKYEHFQFAPLSDVVSMDERSIVMVRERLESAYRAYNRCIMPFYGFFMLDNDKKYKLLFDGVTKEFDKPAPLTKEIFDSLKYKDIIAMTYCGYGAMGEEGAIWVIDNELKQYGIEINTFKELDRDRKIKLLHGIIDLGDGKTGHPRWWANANTKDVTNEPIFKIKDEPNWYGVWNGGGGNYLFFRKELLDGINSYIERNCIKVSNKPSWLYKHRFYMLKYAANYGRQNEDNNNPSSKKDDKKSK